MSRTWLYLIVLVNLILFMVEVALMIYVHVELTLGIWSNNLILSMISNILIALRAFSVFGIVPANLIMLYCAFKKSYIDAFRSYSYCFLCASATIFVLNIFYVLMIIDRDVVEKKLHDQEPFMITFSVFDAVFDYIMAIVLSSYYLSNVVVASVCIWIWNVDVVNALVRSSIESHPINNYSKGSDDI